MADVPGIPGAIVIDVQRIIMRFGSDPPLLDSYHITDF